MQRPRPENSTRIPEFGSGEHLQWLSERLTRNLAFRRGLESFASLGEDEHRRRARELVGERRAVA